MAKTYLSEHVQHCRQELADLMRTYIVEHKLTQKDLSKKLKCKQPAVSNLVTQSYDCTIERLLMFAEHAKAKIRVSKKDNTYNLSLKLPAN